MAIKRILPLELSKQLIKKHGKILINSDIDNFDDYKNFLLDKLNKIEKEKETSGITLSDGTFIRTDDKTQIRLFQAANECRSDDTLTFDWKFSTGKFITLTSGEILNIAFVVREYIQKCLTREKELTNEINNCETIEDLKNIDLYSNWPKPVEE